MVQENGTHGKLSETHAFFLAVKKGELTNVRGYIENGSVGVNTPDQDGNVPLYWACLCDQPPVVAYLLQKGAEYDCSSPSGQRTFLASQNPEIRKILHATSNKDKVKGSKGKGKNNNKLPKSGIQYDDFLKRLFVLRPHSGLEITTSVSNGDVQVVHAHRFLFQARCKHLAAKIETKSLNMEQWKVDTVRTLLKYLYSGEMECPLSSVEDTINMLKELKMETLANDLLEASKTNNTSNLDLLYIKKDTYRKQLQHDFQLLALQGIPKVFAQKVAPQTFHLALRGAMYQDAVFYVEDLDFRVHRVFLEDRSEHFRNLLQHSIDEKLTKLEKLPVVVLSDVQPEIFANLMMYLYTDEIRLTENNTPGILIAAQKYKIHSLTQQILKTAYNMLTCHNVPHFYRAAMETKSKKLIETCISFMGQYLMKLLHRETFRELLVESWRTSSILFNQLGDVIADRYNKEEISETHASEQVERLNEVLCTLHIKPIHNRYLATEDNSGTDSSSDSSSSSGSDTESERPKEQNELQKREIPKPTPPAPSPPPTNRSATSVFHFNMNQEHLERLEKERIIIGNIRDKKYAEPVHKVFYPPPDHPEVVSSNGCTKSKACVIQ